jgi:hypothetical protein
LDKADLGAGATKQLKAELEFERVPDGGTVLLGGVKTLELYGDKKGHGVLIHSDQSKAATAP